MYNVSFYKLKTEEINIFYDCAHSALHIKKQKVKQKFLILNCEHIHNHNHSVF